jgi:2-oxoglutarate dehydrogenase E1 component
MLFEGNLAYLENLYRTWRENPAAVDPAWTPWLQALEEGRITEPPVPTREPPAPASRRPEGRVSPPGSPRIAGSAAPPKAGSAAPPAAGPAQGRLEGLLWAYREVGYFYARLNPLLPGGEPGANYLYPRAKGAYGQLSLGAYGFSEADLDQELAAVGYFPPGASSLRRILRDLEQTYCGSVGVEVLHIQNRPIRNWAAAAHGGDAQPHAALPG